MLLKITPSSLLERTGLGDVFYNALIPCLSYLPTLTPEEESLRLLTAVYPTLVALVKTRFSTKNSPAKMRSFDSILRTGVVKGYAQAGENVKIAEFLVYRMADLVDAMGIYSVKHLKVYSYPGSINKINIYNPPSRTLSLSSSTFFRHLSRHLTPL